MADRGFGKFKSVGEFLASRDAARAREASAAEQGLSFEERVQRRRQQTPNVVEVAATLKRRKADDTSGAQHIQLFITLTKLIQGDPAVDADIQRVLSDGEEVFVAIRTGDSEGITQPILGLVAGVGLDLKGEWIPRDQAGAVGGEHISVLHYTHHPVGFICVAQPPACYQ